MFHKINRVNPPDQFPFLHCFQKNPENSLTSLVNVISKHHLCDLVTKNQKRTNALHFTFLVACWFHNASKCSKKCTIYQYQKYSFNKMLHYMSVNEIILTFDWLVILRWNMYSWHKVKLQQHRYISGFLSNE